MLQLSHHQIINHRQTSWISALVSCVSTSDTLSVSSNELLNVIYSTWWKNSHILCTTKCEKRKTSEKSCADTLHSALVVTVLVPQIYVILMQARNADLSNNKFICRGTLAYEFALRKTQVFLSANSYSILFTLHCSLLSHPVNIEIVVSLNSSFHRSALHHPPHLICTFFFPVQTKHWATRRLHLSASCCPNAATRSFPQRVCNTHHKKKLISAAQALCVTHSLR